MIYEKLSKFKRDAILAAAILMAIGVVLVLCPENYITPLLNVVGAVMLVAATVMVMEFVSGKKSAAGFIKLAVGLFLAVIGCVVMLFETNTIYALAWIFGIYLMFEGVRSIVSSVMFARRSGRRGWQVLIVLGAILILMGLFIVINPWWGDSFILVNIIGWTIMFSSVVNALRLIWVWPFKNRQGGGLSEG